jgi:hypothetical protein
LGDSDNLELKKALTQESITAGVASEGDVAEKREELIEVPYKTKGFIQSFGLLVVEQRKHFVWFILTLVGAMMAAGTHLYPFFYPYLKNLPSLFMFEIDSIG